MLSIIAAAAVSAGVAQLVEQLIRNQYVPRSSRGTSTNRPVPRPVLLPMSASILIVDDDESIRELLRLHLSAAGYEVNVAPDGIAAGYMVLRSPPDLILCDVSMPHMDGFEI